MTGQVMGSIHSDSHLVLEWTNPEQPNGDDPAVLKFVDGHSFTEHTIAFSNTGHRIHMEFFRWLASALCSFHHVDMYDLTSGRFFHGDSRVSAEMTMDQRMYAMGDS